MLKGIGASQGYGIGRAVILQEACLDYSGVVYSGAEAEKARLHRAVDRFTEETLALAESLKESAGEPEAEILSGHLMMLRDPYMLSQMEEAIDGGAVAEAGVDTVCTAQQPQHLPPQPACPPHKP